MIYDDDEYMHMGKGQDNYSAEPIQNTKYLKTGDKKLEIITDQMNNMKVVD